MARAAPRPDPRRGRGQRRQRGLRDEDEMMEEDRDERDKTPLLSDAFGILRGRCRCGECVQFMRASNELLCAACQCPSNRHRRMNYHQVPPSLERAAPSPPDPVLSPETPRCEGRRGNRSPMPDASPLRQLSPLSNSSPLRHLSPLRGSGPEQKLSSRAGPTFEEPHGERGPSSPSPANDGENEPQRDPAAKDESAPLARPGNRTRESSVEPTTFAAPDNSEENPSQQREPSRRAASSATPQVSKKSAFVPPEKENLRARESSVKPPKPIAPDNPSQERKPSRSSTAPQAIPQTTSSTTPQAKQRAASTAPPQAKPRAEAQPRAEAKPRADAKPPAASRADAKRETTLPAKPQAKQQAATSIAPQAKQRSAVPTPDPTPSPRAPSSQEDVNAADAARRARVEVWRKRVQFAQYNAEYRRCSDLCDEMVAAMADEALEWRVPVLVQRAQVYLKWSAQAESERIRRSRIQCAKLDCVAILEEVGGATATNSHAEALLGLGLAMQGQIDLLYGHFNNAKRKLVKAVEAMRKGTDLLVLWGLDLIAAATATLGEVAKAAGLQTDAEDALSQNKPLRCLRQLDALLALCPVSVQGLSLRADALLATKRWADVESFCQKVKSELDPKTDRRLFANVTMAEAKGAYARGSVEDAVVLAESLDAIFMQGENRSALTLWRRLSDEKAKGNAAFAEASYSRALEHYAVALSLCTSQKLRAILHSNRAATHMARKQYKLALNDCDEALRLDPNYTKAILRRARAGGQLHGELSCLLRARADYHRAFRRDHALQAAHRQELEELELRISSLKKAELEAKEARQKQSRARPSEKTPEKNPRKNPAGARPRKTAPSSRPASAKPKSWKERQDEQWQEWFSSAKNRPARAQYKSTSSSSSSASSSKPASSSSSSSSSASWSAKGARRPRTAGSSRSWGGGARSAGSGFGSSDVAAWLDSNGRVKNFYQALGLSRGAGIDRSAIKKAFHRLALKHHPDKTQAASEPERMRSETTFKRVAEAYAVLGDDEVRKKYDRFARCIG